MNREAARHCTANGLDSEPRRKVIKIFAAGLTVPLALHGGSAQARPAAGDRLVPEDAEGDIKPLKPADIEPGKPMLAFPYDPAAKLLRGDSRLNKVLLMRFDEQDMDEDTRSRAADGVIAFSAICTHQSCEVKTWLSKEKALVCYCHASKFLPLERGTVTSGPAPRGLPVLPLRLEGGELVVAAPFSTPPGTLS